MRLHWANSELLESETLARRDLAISAKGRPRSSLKRTKPSPSVYTHRRAPIVVGSTSIRSRTFSRTGLRIEFSRYLT